MIAVDMQPVPVTVPSSSWPFATAIVRSPSETWSTGPGDRGDAPSVAGRLARQLRAARAAPTASTPRISACPPGERRDLGRVAAHDGDVELGRAAAATSRSGSSVAPAPTGSSTTGTPARFAARPASSIASTQSSESVPMLSTSAAATEAISSTSCGACAITGSAPSASVAFAVSFMTT